MKKIRWIFLGLIAVLITSALVWFQLLAPVQSKAPTETISFSDDTATILVVSKLRQEGFIKSDTALNLILLFNNHDGQLPAGGYQVSKSMNVFEISEALIKGPQFKWIQIVSGMRKEQIEEKLGLNLTGEEGKYYPDTYLIPKNASGEEVTKIMQDHFKEVAGGVGPRTLIIASLVQREAAGPSDAPLVAGIIWNRVLRGGLLQIDASNQYAKGHTGDWWPPIYPADLKIDSPYNLYLHKGLPPSPISNPSLYAISAVLNPAQTDCQYYLHDHSRQIHCSVTYDQHLANIAEFLH